MHSNETKNSELMSVVKAILKNAFYFIYWAGALSLFALSFTEDSFNSVVVSGIFDNRIILFLYAISLFIIPLSLMKDKEPSNAL